MTKQSAMLPTTEATPPQWQVGFSLPQKCYMDEEIFRHDLDFLADEWIIVDHGSRIPGVGNFFTIDVGADSIIVIRGADDVVRAFYNVCRHRGSLLCTETSGTVKALICPYHAWTYDLTGMLKGAALMPTGFDRKDYSLKACHCREVHGLIVINLSREAPRDLQRLAEPVIPFLVLHGIKTAKIAARRSYPTAANWKLVVENFSECYHCLAAHPTYASVHSTSRMLAVGAGFGSADEGLTQQFLPAYEEWAAYSRSLGYPVNRTRKPIGPGKFTASEDGQPVSRLMGDFNEYDGGSTGINFGSHTGNLSANNDYAVIFRFLPRSVSSTDVEAIWLVDEDAREGTDYDVERLIRLWDVTLREDKMITENNQRGVSSKAYEPGPYSRQEQNLVRFTQFYMSRLWKKGAS
jgi:phenylpropionate dioxygenase-like ring-hydroxylating dioxygenase large terminal subunit